ncbi:MAG: glycoside hydrolase family 78 protein [Candidatus Thorarchaeota archaeon]
MNKKTIMYNVRQIFISVFIFSLFLVSFSHLVDIPELSNNMEGHFDDLIKSGDWRVVGVGDSWIKLQNKESSTHFKLITFTHNDDTFYPKEWGDGSYGYQTDSSSSWATAHSASSGNEYSNSFIYVFSREVSDVTAKYIIHRGFIPFDTSSIPDDATIISASLNIYVTEKYDEDNDDYATVAVVQTTQQQTTAINSDGLGDYSRCGDVSNPTLGSSEIDITGISVSAYLEIVLNATGRGWINKTGITKLGIREGHDIHDTPVLNDTKTGIQVNTRLRDSSYMAYLTISYNSTPSADTPTVQGYSSSPQKDHITDHTPTLGWTFNDNGDGDTQSGFEVEVWTGSGGTGTNMLDTGEQVSSSQSYIYNGSALSDGSTYYYRVKVKDSQGTWSDWSELAFTMNTEPTAPSLSSPADGSETTDTTPDLVVNNGTDAESDTLTYYFEIDTADTFDTADKQSSSGVSEGTDTTTWTVPNALTDNTVWYWRCRSCDGYEYSSWMTTVSVVVNTANDSPNAFDLSSPADASTVTTTPALIWEVSTDPDPNDTVTYTVEIDDTDSTFSSPEVTKTDQLHTIGE